MTESAEERAKAGLTMIGTGAPQATLLDLFGEAVYSAFGHHPYLVGSAARGKDWRDVDVVCILDDEEWDALFGTEYEPPPDQCQDTPSPRLAIVNLAFSTLATKMSGLPVDFKFQRQSDINKRTGDKHRHALMLGAAPNRPLPRGLTASEARGK